MDGALLDALRGVRWPARRPVPGAVAGAHRSRLRGAAAEFTEYRPYRQGDDPRRLDWRLLARSDRAYIRLADDHAVLPTTIVLDASASMAFPAREPSKWGLARQLGVGLAAVAHASGDPVGLVVPHPTTPLRFPPRTRRGVLAELMRRLDAVAPAGDAALAPAVAPLTGRGRLAIVSDFLGDADALLALARQHYVAGGEVYAVHVAAREELEPPADGLLAVDPEAPAVRRTLAEATRVEYLAAFGAWREALARAWREAGAVYALVATDEAPAHAVRRLAAPGGGAGERR